MLHNSQSCKTPNLPWHHTKRDLADQQHHCLSICRRVAAFVDIEAEASDDEAEEDSADDPEGEEEEATESDAMFVHDDASPASIRSQPERGYMPIP